MGALTVSDSGFTWINRDAENLASKEHGRSVRAHIQKQRRSQLSRLKQRTQFPWNRPENFHCKGEPRQIHEQILRRSSHQKPDTTRTPTLSYPSASLPIIRRALPDKIPSPFTNANKTTPRGPSKLPDYLLPCFSSSPLSSPLTSQLDPFFYLPCHVTERDKSLLHLYFTITPRAVYGTHNNASICPIRDVTAIGVQADRTFLQWIVLGAELYLLQGKPSPVDQPHILSRKAYIYKLMNRAIADPTVCYSDVTFATMGAAAIAGARFEGPAQGQKHLIALRKFMKARGGSRILQDMLLAYSISITNCFINTGTEYATFTDLYHLGTATHDFSSTFKAMQTWNQSLRIAFEVSYDDFDGNKYADGRLPSVPEILDFAQVHDLQTYRLSRSKVFGPQSILRRYIPPIHPLPVASERRCHFAALWMINKMLYDLRHDYRESRAFIERLSSEVTACEIPKIAGSFASTGTPLKPLAIIYILETVVVKHSPKSASRGGILHAWDSIDPLELVELATEDSHTEVTALLSSWLTNDKCDLFYMTENRLDEISEEIMTEWLRLRTPRGKH